MKLRNNKLLKNLGAVFLGAVFVLFVLEMSLQFWSFFQNRLENKPQKINDDQFVILALGESTTVSIKDFQGNDFSWPALLQELLNQGYDEIKFKVVNLGVGGTNSAAILDNLPDYLEKYKPDLVVSMMGINDYGQIEYEAAAGLDHQQFRSKLRTYQLYKFLWAQIRDHDLLVNLKEITKTECNSEPACLAEARFYEKNDQTQQAIVSWQRVVDFNPKNTEALLWLGRHHFARGQFNQAVDYYQHFLELESLNEEVKLDLAHAYLQQGKGFKAYDLFKEVLARNPQQPRAYLGLIYTINSIGNESRVLDELLQIEHDLDFYQVDSAEVYTALAGHGQYYNYGQRQLQLLEKAHKIAPDDLSTLISLARYHVQHDNLDQAEKYYLSALENDQAGSLVILELIQLYEELERDQDVDELISLLNEQHQYVYHYLQLYQNLNEQQIPLVAVQYPMRSIKPLAEIFQNKEGVWLVDNQASFQQLIDEIGKDQVFLDLFAGDFGHCTQRGNDQIAQNIMTVLESNWKELGLSEETLRTSNEE